MSDQIDNTTHDAYELDELLGAYALDAVTSDERRRVEDYLTINPRAAAEVRNHREVATMLAYTGMDAPSGLWDRIEAAIDAPAPAPGPELATVLAHGAGGRVALGLQLGEDSDVHAAPSEPAAGTDELAERRARKPRHRAFTPWLAAAAAAAVVAVVSFGLADRAGAPTSPLSEAFELAQADRDSVETTLRSENSTAEAPAVIDQDGHGYIDATSLPTLAAGQTYQLWGVMADNGDVISLGVLGPNPEVEPFTAEGSIAALAVTIEAAPGVISDGNPDGAFVGEF